MSSSPRSTSGLAVEFSNLIEVLRTRARESPGARAFTFLDDGDRGESHLSYAGLDERARAIATLLVERGARGERVLLLYPPGLEYIAAFFGCLYAGAVAVPAYPPRLNRSLPRLRSILEDARPRVALTTSTILGRVEGWREQEPWLGAIPWLETGSLALNRAADWEDPGAGEDTLAFLQYTSGSTGTPKGVMLSHGNLLHNSRELRRCFGYSAESRGMVWLPPYHDMGLIGGILQPLHGGFPATLMAPVAFLQNPLRWLAAISRDRATISGGPDFAYDLCVRRISPAEREALDLSSWEVAFSGAEPVRAATLERFAQAFAPCGFRWQAFYPCYGLAEATLIASGGPAFTGAVERVFEAGALEGHHAVPAVEGKRLVGNGQCLTGQRLAVVDPGASTSCPPGVVGEIWVAGPSVAQGYWNRPEETGATFGAYLPGGDGPYLRTGDLGFLEGGELFITGRLKDLIIIRGRNHYPQDVEATVEAAHPSLRPGCSAAFSVEVEGEERLVVVAELERAARGDLEGVAEAVRQAVAREHEVQVREVVLIRVATLPKTSSGKIQRRACRSGYLAGELVVVGRSAVQEAADAGDAGDWITTRLARADLSLLPRNERAAALLRFLRQEAARALRLSPWRIEPALPLAAHGLDSLGAVELKSHLEASFEIELPLEGLLEGASLAQIADEILARLEAPAASPARTRAPRIVALPGAAGEGRPSMGQRALWLLERLSPGSAANHIVAAARVRSSVDVPALRRAFSSLVERHPALRTTFAEVHGEPVMRVQERMEIEILEQDASPETLDSLMAEAAWRPFDLERGPLLRVVLFPWAAAEDGERVLLLAVHHIVSDFWSLGVLARELGRFYAAEVAGRSAALDPPALDFHDWVAWQEERLAGPEGERLWSYWLERLAGELPHLDLPADRPRPPVQSHRGGSRTLLLGSELAESLRRFSRERGATLYVTLLAAFQTLLHRYTGQEDLLVGSPTAGRPVAEVEGVVGYFVNPVVLRADFSAASTLEEVLTRTRSAVLGALAHADLPLALLAERLQPVRDPSRPVLFQVMFVLQNARDAADEALAAFALGVEGARMDLGGLAVEPWPFEQRRSQFDLTLVTAETAGGLGISLQYNADLFDASTMVRLGGHYANLLAGIVEGARERRTGIHDLPLLSPAELEQVLKGWNDTGAGRLAGHCLHQLFEAQAARTPEAEALVFGETRWSYREVDARAGRLARRLAVLGVGPEVRVSLFAERSAEMVEGVLGILKAGGAYVPIDPAYPPERVAFLLSDSRSREGPAVLLTQERLLPRLPALPAADRVICLDRPEPETAAVAPGLPGRPSVTPGNLAYLIYTSGSTGRPKGVAIEHRSAAALVGWAHGVFSAGELAGVLAATSICFDLSVFELFAPLTRGGKVVLAANALELPLLPARDEITLINTVPSAMAELVRLRGVPASVRTVCLAGEPLPRALADQIHGIPTVERLYNLYGPSEDTTYSTEALIPRGDDRPPAIGRPIAGTRSYVLGAGGEPVSPGVAGELYLGGAGLARGYLNRPDLTAGAFLPDPWGEPGARLYRTGDLARYRASGELEFLGRIDHQVKVRGFRIELGEIEAALAGHPGVEEAVVLAREDRPGDRRLVAYVVTRGGLDTMVLREHLRERLPEFMLPADFVLLAALPRTPNGKLDRKALPAPDRAAADSREAAWATPVEELLAGIWAELLGVESPRPDDNFFASGGHSLMAARLVARVRDLLGAELPLAAVFETPTLAGLVGRIERIRRETLGLVGAPPLLPVPRAAGIPLSYAQERLWFLDRMEPAGAAYNMPFLARLDGPLDVAAFGRALDGIVRRHEVLRTTFVAGEDGRAGQIISPPGPPGRPAASAAFSVIDLSGLAEPWEESRRWLAVEARRPFDLALGPLLRTVLLRLDAQSHLALVVQHHIVSDGWSIGVFLRELAALYAGSPLPDLPVQYADYAVWQRSWLASGVLESQLAYWRERLQGAPLALELPTDRPRPPVQGFRGGERSVLLGGLAHDLQVLGRREGATPFMVLLAGFQALLQRYSGQDDLLVGSPVAGRGRSELEPLIGFFVNTLVLRGDLTGDPGFAELLARVRGTCLGAYSHQDVPFERLVEELRPERDLSRPPLFQVMLTHQGVPFEIPDLLGISASALPLASGTAKFDLTLALAEEEAGLAASLEYDASLFDGATAQRLLGSFAVLLTAAVSDPGRPLAALPLLSEVERQQLLEWNESEPPAAAACLHELFELQAKRTPGATALVFGLDRLTYAELDARASRWARRLAGLGVRPEVAVGICAERTPEMVVGMLAVLKAGGAYVPLDPNYPAQRLSWILEDLQDGAEPPVVLTQRRLLPKLEGMAARTVCLDEAWNDQERGKETEPRPVGLGNLAYVIYTSGSTGRPKGVAIEHRTAAALVPWSHGVFSDAEMAGVLAATSINFDMSVFELWVTLARGGKLILAANALELPSLPARDEVTLVDTVPSAIAELVRGGGIPVSVRTVNLGGEPLSRSLVDGIYGSGAVERVLNLYGPSEDTTFSTFVCVPRGEEGAPTIGRPLAGTQAFVLDRRLDPVPLGVPGELYLGGAGTSRGYLRRPGLTAERYIPDPFGPPGARMYKTGDLTRWLPDGQLEYLGRMDHQVKVRGFRVELGEVEAALAAHEALGDALVVAREDRSGGLRLVAYVVPGSAAVPAAELRRFLQGRLPEFMIPSAFVMLLALPLTPNGKVDRKALPAPDEARIGPARFAAPRTPEEELLAGIWSELLGVERVGIDDDFFDLGGHSLLAIRVAARVRGVFEVELPVRSLFEAPTVASLAALVARARRPDGAAAVTPIPLASRTAGLPLSYAQERLWFLDQLAPGGSAYNVPVAVRLAGDLDLARFAGALSGVAGRHEALRTRFGMAGGRPVQVIDPEPRLPLGFADLSGLAGSARDGEARRVLAREARRAFDLERGPVARALLLRLEAGEHLALLNLHHIVADGWSLGVLLREVAALYQGVPLPELPVQYADYAVWQRQWLEGAVLATQVTYWRERLAGAPPELGLPADRPRPARPTLGGGRRAVTLEERTWQGVRALARAYGATPFIVLLAVFQALLSRLTGEEDILVGAPVANRRHAESENLIGCFINTLVLRTSLVGDPPFYRIVERAREAALGAWDHQDVPFERLVEELQPERDPARPPFFQVVLVLQNTPMPTLELSGLKLEAVEAETGTAKFDLTLSLTERSEHEGGAAGWLEYSADLFDPATAERIGAAFERLAAAAVESPRQRLSELPLPWEESFVSRRPNREARRTPAPLAAGAPRTLLEELLADLWIELLGVQRVGPGDDFFGLGGHSLLGARLVSRLRETLRVELPLRTLFEAPTLAALAQAVEEARREERSGEAAPLVPRPRAVDPTLSFAQERLWFLDQLEPGSPAYNVPMALRLEGRLDTGAFRRSLDEIVRRHEALRTTFPRWEGQPVQRIAPPGPAGLPVIDLSGLSERRREAEAGERVRWEAGRPFDLEAGPLVRASLLRFGVEEHMALLTLHHIVSDGWSMGVLVHELTALYAGGGRSPLPELPIQYADYAVWQREWLAGEVLEAQLAYWRERLAGAPAALDLPTDRPRPAVQSLAGGSVSVTLPPDFSRHAGGTLFMTLLAGFQALLFRYSGQEDLVVGSPVANRARGETERLIGLFVNTLALRGRPAGGRTFRELLAETRETSLDAYAHQDLPFERLVEELRPERELSRPPLFQVMLVHQNTPLGELALPGLALRPVEPPSGTAKFELTLALTHREGGVSGTLEYSAALFDPATAQRLAGHFEALLRGAVEEPETRLEDLPLLTFSEHQQLLEWNGSEPAAAVACLHDLFAAQVKRTPGATALVFGAERFTYAELDARAGRWARRLAWLGVGPEVPVGICAERTPEMVVGMLAVLKAGGAYVPLDPNYPAQRLAWILEDLQDGAEPPVVLTQRRLLPKIEGMAARAACLDEGWEDAGEEAEPRAASLGNLAYVIYTSGSTGRPKGVAIEHRTAAALVPWSREVFSDAEMAGVLAATSINFDMSVFELWVTLARGGKLILAANALELPSLPARGEVTLVDTVPSAIAELVRGGGIPPSVRTVNLGGEPLSRSLVDGIYGSGAVERVLNLYGPSEDTTFSTCVCVPRGEERAPTIGRPLAGTQAFVLDRRLNPSPLGVPGELYLGGAGLSRGYLGRPELTAERYVPDPFGSPGARLYQTGDLARYLPDGQLEYLGRMDHQVKVRGFRVELGEVEAALAAHPDIAEAVVLAVPVDEDIRLTACWVPKEEGAARPAVAELRGWLLRTLPQHMVPSSFLRLANLPLTPNGKVDRRTLAQLGTGAEHRPNSGEAGAAPSGPVEELLAGIWAEILRVDRVGAHENFFELGGHSLLAAQVVSRVRESLGVELPLRALFTAPTVAALAAEVESAGGATGAGVAPPIVPVPRQGAIPLSYAQERLWFLDQLEPGGGTFNIPAAVRLTGSFRKEVFARSLIEIVHRHESLRTTFGREAGGPVQVIAPAVWVALPLIDLAALPGEARHRETARLAAEEAARPFDLAHGPLLRSGLLRLEDGEHVALVTLHHIVADGWSMGVFLRELTALYRAFAAGEPSPLPDLPVQYADYALWQRSWLQGPPLERQLAYWRQRLAGASQNLDLPIDRPRPAVQTFRSGQFSLRVPAGLCGELYALSRCQGATLFMTLLAAFELLLSRHSGQEDFSVGTPIAGRNRARLEGLIGFFLNTLVLRADLAGNPTFHELVSRVREAALGAYTHQDVPFERLLEELRPERNPSRTPLFQVLFNMLNLPEVHVELPGLTLRAVPSPTAGSKFDLTLYVSEDKNRIDIEWVYNADLFDPARIALLARQLASLLAQAVERPGSPVDAFSLLTAEDRALLPDPMAPLVPEWHGAVHHRFTRAARSAPERPAILAGDRVWTYAELDAASDGLAHHLRSAGIGTGDVVAIYAQRGAGLILALLGALKTGAAFLVLDSVYPEARVASCLVQARPRALVALEASGPLTAGLEEVIATLAPLCRVNVPEDWCQAGWAAPPASFASARVGPDDLAYVAFTSGSTGVPKGILGGHGPLSHFLTWHIGNSGLNATDRFSLLSGLSHDPLLRDVFTPLCLGAALCIPRAAEMLEPGKLVAWLAGSGVTVAHLTPAMGQLLDSGGATGTLPLRRAFFGGGVLNGRDVVRLRRLAPGCTAVNFYGTTETPQAMAFHPVAGEPREGALPLGRGIDGVQLLVLSRSGDLAAPGERGEIHVRTPYLAQGYLGDPALTAERFLANPWTGTAEDRLYRTGDLGRYRLDGTVEFLGRADDQVNIRGFRVEPGEVQTMLCHHPRVKEAVVVAREEDGENRLVAYVVPGVEPAPTVRELRDFLRETLPEHMVPAAFVLLGALPLTPNKKVDRRALPAPEAGGVERQAYVAPRTLAEELLAGIWAEVLKVERVGARDNFFDLGGHSLLAAQVIARVREAADLDLPLRSLFQNPTLEGLAAALEDLLLEQEGEAP